MQSLALSCTFRGEDLGVIPQRRYFIRRSTAGQPFQGFIKWSDRPWPPLLEDSHSLAMALAEALGVNTVETFLSFINADASVRRQLLDLAGASERLEEVERELDETDAAGTHEVVESDSELLRLSPTDGHAVPGADSLQPVQPPSPRAPAAPVVPLRRFEDLLFEGESVHVEGTGPSSNSTGGAGDTGTGGGGGASGPAPTPKAAAGMDLEGLDRLGMQITLAFEQHRLAGRTVTVLPSNHEPGTAESLIVDVSSPKMIAAAEAQSAVVRQVFDDLGKEGISRLFPGYDILTIVDGKVDRMIELKSSGVDAQVQAMSWNEWKTAGGAMREHFWLYLVGNLRADLQHALPFVRAIQDPFGTLKGSTAEDVIRRRSVQLRIREFAAADELVLQLKAEGTQDRAYRR